MIQIADSGKNEELDWLSPPPKVSRNAQRTVVEDSTLKELRYACISRYMFLLNKILFRK